MRALLLAPLALAAAFAHVGSPDVYFDGKAGAYQVYATIRAPQVIPGVAEIELRVPGQGVDRVRITPMPLTGPGAKFAPTPDTATRSAQDPAMFTGSLWMMSTGSWQVRVEVTGSQGSGELRIPVPALARRTLEMDRALAATLLVLMTFLAVGLVSIAGAASREGKLAPGLEPPAANKTRARVVMAGTAVLVALALWGGKSWWDSEAATYSRNIFKPLGMSTSIQGNTLTLRLEHTGWFQDRDFSDLVPDHNYLMHLFVVSQDMARVWHLHPKLVSNGVFTQSLPAMPPGKYRLFGDIVHRGGLPETVTAELDVPSLAGEPLAGDDSAGVAPAQLTTVSPLSSGYRMVFDAPADIRAKRLQVMKFRVEDAKGKPAEGMELYLGMPGHAAAVRKDFAVFAHLHPSGTVPMAALAMAQPDASTDPHAGHAMHAALPAEVTFPYGFPQGGEYRLFVQMKRAGVVETGVFDVVVKD